MSIVKVPRYEPCSWCGGHGMRHGYPDGYPEECSACGGGGQVEARDERGRFMPWDEITIDDEDQDA